jgi:hypothetical protein
MPNIMHRGAGAIAQRVLGEDSPETRRIVYRWASEVAPEQRPFAIHKDGRTIFSWESDIACAAEHPGATITKAPFNADS